MPDDEKAPVETEETEEVQEEITEENVVDEELLARWKQVAPELVDGLDELAPETQVKFLLNRLAASQQEKSATGDTSKDTPTNTQAPGQPSTAGNNFDRDENLQKMGTAFAEGDGTEFVRLLDEHDKQLARTMMDALNAQDVNITALRLPSQLRQAMADVPGAQESDIGHAARLIDNGDVANHKMALMLAVADRQAELAVAGGKPKKTASEEAKRKANALAADKAGRSATPSGTLPDKFPSTPGEMQELMERELADRNAAKT